MELSGYAAGGGTKTLFILSVGCVSSKKYDNPTNKQTHKLARYKKKHEDLNLGKKNKNSRPKIGQGQLKSQEQVKSSSVSLKQPLAALANVGVYISAKKNATPH